MTDTAVPPASTSKKFEGDGLSFKGKLIGMEDLSIDRDEKICLDAMFKLKAVVRARGEHKQKIQLNLNMSTVKIIDDITKTPVASHEVERISFVVIDPKDTRAFGYIYNTVDDRHQFWAIKTERAAAATVVALKELFEVAFEEFTSTEKAKLEAKKPPTSPESSGFSDTTQSPPVVPTTTPSLLDDPFGFDSTPTTTQTTATTNGNLWDFDAPSVPVIIQPPPRTIDPLEELFGPSSLTQPSVPTNTPNFTPPPTNPYANSSFSLSTTESNHLNATPILPQQQYFTPRAAPPPPQDPSLLAPRSLPPVAPPSVTNPFAGFDLLGDLSYGIAPRPTKESFLLPQPPPKTIQQLQMEKQRNPFAPS